MTQETAELAGVQQVARAAGWWLPHKEICWVSERHSVVALDVERRLHCEDGPAVLYPDGWAIYAWHGVRVPEKVILHPLDLTVGEISREENVEVRRVMLQQYGEARYLLDSGAKKLQEDRYGALYRVEFRGDEPLVMVRVVNSTLEPDGSAKTYWLRVPPEMQTARAAVAWSFDMIEQDYCPAIET